jgi:hypothetical protein
MDISPGVLDSGIATSVGDSANSAGTAVGGSGTGAAGTGGAPAAGGTGAAGATDGAGLRGEDIREPFRPPTLRVDLLVFEDVAQALGSFVVFVIHGHLYDAGRW